eukprot:Lithocolla_globosa_v1_NODE_4545_length_1412_cov_63.562270.p1 type:complete len:301 gc:universal NODE_4545_length_1412_cov_63.562270:60-962(+)
MLFLMLFKESFPISKKLLRKLTQQVSFGNTKTFCLQAFAANRKGTAIFFRGTNHGTPHHTTQIMSWFGALPEEQRRADQHKAINRKVSPNWRISRVDGGYKIVHRKEKQETKVYENLLLEGNSVYGLFGNEKKLLFDRYGAMLNEVDWMIEDNKLLVYSGVGLTLTTALYLAWRLKKLLAFFGLLMFFTKPDQRSFEPWLKEVFREELKKKTNGVTAWLGVTAMELADIEKQQIDCVLFQAVQWRNPISGPVWFLGAFNKWFGIPDENQNQTVETLQLVLSAFFRSSRSLWDSMLTKFRN